MNLEYINVIRIEALIAQAVIRKESEALISRGKSPRK